MTVIIKQKLISLPALHFLSSACVQLVHHHHRFVSYLLVGDVATFRRKINLCHLLWPQSLKHTLMSAIWFVPTFARDLWMGPEKWRAQHHWCAQVMGPNYRLRTIFPKQLWISGLLPCGVNVSTYLWVAGHSKHILHQQKDIIICHSGSKQSCFLVLSIRGRHGSSSAGRAERADEGRRDNIWQQEATYAGEQTRVILLILRIGKQ